jgi:hypothetical protein
VTRVLLIALGVVVGLVGLWIAVIVSALRDMRGSLACGAR